MTESKFQFRNPYLLSLDFTINPGFKPPKEERVPLDADFNVDISRNDNNTAVVTLTVSFGDQTEKSPFWIEASECAQFRWEEGINAEDYLRINAPAVLLGYLRPVISMVTALSPHKTLDIPLIDFTQNKNQGE